MMAVVENIREQKQTPSAQRGVIDYCCRADKTHLDEKTVFVSGVNCVQEMANDSFLATQNLFCHKTGARFYHYVQSFSPEENITPKQVHEIGLELAKVFGEREVLVATHIDRDHLHNHFVVNAYDLNDGRKLHANKFFLGTLRAESDRLCAEQGLSVLPPYDPKEKSTNLRPREYRAALSGSSWKIRLCAEIDACMALAHTRREFFAEMKKRGYGVTWSKDRKYITYIKYGEDGKDLRVRDFRLHERKYEKEMIEREFRIREKHYGRTEGEEYDAARVAADGTDYSGGMEEAVAASAGSSGAGQFGMVGGKSDPRRKRNDGESHKRADGGNPSGVGGSDKENGEHGAEPLLTGWERERESLRQHRERHARGQNPSDRQFGAAVPRGDGHSGLQRLGWLGLGSGSLLADPDETEEERKRREAIQNGSALGAAVGLAAGALIHHRDDGDEDDTPKVDSFPELTL